MTLLTRINRLFRADIHAVLDNLEEPSVLLRQAIREMEDVLGDEERRLRALRQARSRLAALEAEEKTDLPRLEDELELCLAAGKDELSRAVIRRQLEAARRRTQCMRQAESLDQGIIELETCVLDHRQRLGEMRLAASAAEAACAQGQPDPLGVLVADEDKVSDDAVELALLRAKARRSAP
jgi:phage shock protein A